MWRLFLEHCIFTVCGFSANIVYMAVAPVLPLEIERRHLSSFCSGIIFCYSSSNFSSNSAGYFSAFFVSKSLIKKCG